MTGEVEFICQDSNMTPSKGSKDSIGYDLYCPVSTVLTSRKITKIQLDLKLNMPRYLWAQICDRSSMGKKGVHVYGGVIDPDYKGIVAVLLFNHTETDIVLERGDRIAQLIFHYSVHPPCNVISSESERGDGGFGSTGK